MPVYSVESTPNVSYFTPKQPRLGEFIKYNEKQTDMNQENAPPKLFQPLNVRSMHIPNRIGVSPMCTYSSNDFMPTDFHLVHYGAWASRGAGIVMVECSSIDEDGALSSNDLGMWTEEQAKCHYSKIVEFCKSQGANIGCQLGHCGRRNKKVHQQLASSDEKRSLYLPHELSKETVKDIVHKWGQAAKLAIEVAKYDFVEIQVGHGHMLSEFCSSTINKRTDEYGGDCFENKTRLLLEIVDEVRNNIGEEVPLFLRISTHDGDHDEMSWENTDELIRLSFELCQHGVDVLDIAGGGSRVNEIKSPRKKELMKRVKQEHLKSNSRLIIASPAGVTNPEDASKLIGDGIQDLVLVGRPFLENPGLVWTWATTMGVTVQEAVQYTWGFYPDKEHLRKMHKNK